MLPFQDENMKKAAERLLEYSGTLSATFDLLRSDVRIIFGANLSAMA